MRKLILIVGTATVLTATPAMAGGPGGGGGLLGGVTGAVGNVLGGGTQNSFGGRVGSLGGGCLCQTVNGIVGGAGGMGGSAGNPGSLMNSVAGLGSLDMRQLETDSYRACVYRAEERLQLCFFVNTDQSPAGIKLDPTRTRDLLEEKESAPV